MKTHHKDNMHKIQKQISNYKNPVIHVLVENSQPLATFEPHIFLNLKNEQMKTCREDVKISILESLGFPQPELIDLTDEDLPF